MINNGDLEANAFLPIFESQEYIEQSTANLNSM